MPVSIDTIVLRYRDLSSKNTISLHNEVIDKKGFVWWGWWAKPQERVPLEIFDKLKQRSLTESHFELYLLDSGKSELRKAQCIDIIFDNNFIASPLKSATPKYYSKSEYMMWFKIDRISEVLENPNEVIKKFSYIKIDDHFASRISPFYAFEGKRVYNTDEMIEQQCTIWYLRKAIDTDDDRQIISYAPEASDQTFEIDVNNKVLWLSDLHFSEKHHGFIKTVGSSNTLFEVLKNKLDDIGLKKFTKILTTGDFTFSADSTEFNQANAFFEQMSSCYSINGSSLIFCPGNHDMKYSDEAYTNDDAEVVLNYSEAKKPYVDFYEKTKGTTTNEYISSVNRFITSNGVLVEMISLNTCILQQDIDHFRGMGYAGNDQLSYLSKILKKTEKMNTVRVLVMHHNLFPVLYSEKPQINPMYSMLLDSEAISQFCIKNNICLVLHGHTHIDYFSESTRKRDNKTKSFYVVGLGSTGAISNDLTVNSVNQFATLEFQSSCIEIKIFDLNPTGSTESKQYIVHTIPYGDK